MAPTGARSVSATVLKMAQRELRAAYRFLGLMVGLRRAGEHALPLTGE